MKDLIKGCKKHREYCEEIGIKARAIGIFTEQFPDLRDKFMQRYIGSDRKAILKGIKDDLKRFRINKQLKNSLIEYYSSIVIEAQNQQAKKDGISGRGTSR